MRHSWLVVTLTVGVAALCLSTVTLNAFPQIKTCRAAICTWTPIGTRCLIVQVSCGTNPQSRPGFGR